MRSLHHRLLLVLLLIMGGTFALNALIGYFGATHEMDELFDAQLIQTARVLDGVLDEPAGTATWTALNQALSGPLPEGHAPDNVPSDGYDYARKLAVQVWTADGQLLLRTPSAPAHALAPLRPGFYRQRAGRHAWHVFSTQTPRAGHWLLVAERDDVRRELSRNVGAGLVLSGIVALLLAAWLIRRSLRRELAPLHQLHDALAARHADHLDPVDLEDPPAELAPVVAALNTLFQRVTDSRERERRFLADAAHELRTPLAVLRLQAENAIAAGATAAQRQHLERLIAGVDRSTRVVEQLLLLARLDAGTQPFRPQPVALDEVAREVLAGLAPLALARRQEISLDCTGDARLQGEPALLGALLRNLVENALRHSPEGGQVTVTLAHQAAELCLRVEDNGPGADPARLATLAQRFVRDSRHDQGGSGLGLSIASHIASLHHGRLLLSNREAGGLCAEVRLPVSPVPAPVSDDAPAA